MDVPFDFDLYEGDYYLATIEGIARIEQNEGSGIHDDWTVDRIEIFGKREAWELIPLPDTSPYWEPILLHLLNDCRHDIDDEWATHIAEDRAGSRGDAQRDEMISRELLS